MAEPGLQGPGTCRLSLFPFGTSGLVPGWDSGRQWWKLHLLTVYHLGTTSSWGCWGTFLPAISLSPYQAGTWIGCVEVVFVSSGVVWQPSSCFTLGTKL